VVFLVYVEKCLYDRQVDALKKGLKNKDGHAHVDQAGKSAVREHSTESGHQIKCWPKLQASRTNLSEKQ
jgi:hypothetical protein